MEIYFPLIEVSHDSNETRLALQINYEQQLCSDDEIVYTLKYDRKEFDLVPSYETAASFFVPDTIQLVFSKDTLQRIFAISRTKSSIIEIRLTRDDTDSGRQGHEYSINLVHGMKRFSLTTNQFQDLQTKLPHLTPLDMSLSGCQFEDLLAEILNKLRMIVVLDRPTSYSRTCWLSGNILDEPVLIVLDGIRRSPGDRVSVDTWSNLERIDEAILEILAETRIGDVTTGFRGLNVTWNLDVDQDAETLLTVMVSSKPEMEHRVEGPIYFTLDYQGLLTERFETPFPRGQQQASIAADLSGIRASWNGSISEPYFAIHVSDAKWKTLERAYPIIFTWRQAMEHQTKLKLSSGNRFRSLAEFSKFLNMMEDKTSSLRLFAEFCLNRELAGCKSQRAAAHCARAAILTGLVVCFNPPRGLSDYLKMVTDSRAPKMLEEFGTPRTWRDHISQIVQVSSDFVPQTAKLARPNNNKRPGRPPTQLIPTAHPLELFNQFIKDPESLVCRYCRFLRTDGND